MQLRISAITISLFTAVFAGCGSGSDPMSSSDELPVLGQRQVVKTDEEGNEYFDTIYTQIDNFAFIDQDSQIVTEEDFEGKVRVVDFFFTSCPTICPDMKKQMLRIYRRFNEDDRVRLLSHSIDTRHDSVPVLKNYAEKMDVKAPPWHLVTGDKNMIYNLAERYMVSAEKDESAPGGYLHSGAFVLLDGKHRIRGYYDGIDAKEVDQLMIDIEKLLAEE